MADPKPDWDGPLGIICDAIAECLALLQDNPPDVLARVTAELESARGGLPETPSDFGCHQSELIIILAVKPKRIHPVCDGKANGRSDQKIPHQGNY